jgi:hypothetical protein
MSEEYKLTTDVDMNTVPAHVTVEDIKYFEDKVKRNPWDKKAQLQLASIKKHFGVEE